MFRIISRLRAQITALPITFGRFDLIFSARTRVDTLRDTTFLWHMLRAGWVIMPGGACVAVQMRRIAKTKILSVAKRNRTK
jgi:hypothetical protein